MLRAMKNTVVRFVESGSGVLSLLEVETERGRGLFGRVSAALFLMRIQLVRAESKLERGRRVERLWLVEFDGAPIRPNRRLAIQDEVMRAVESGPAAPRAYLTSSRPRRLDDELEPVA
jgi:hypothetical protein